MGHIWFDSQSMSSSVSSIPIILEQSLGHHRSRDNAFDLLIESGAILNCRGQTSLTGYGYGVAELPSQGRDLWQHDSLRKYHCY